MKKITKLLAIVFVLVIADQVTKIAVRHYMHLHESIQLIPGFFNLTYILNPGGAFGFMASQSLAVRNFLFLFVSSIAICIILYFYFTAPKKFKFLPFGYALILGGACGNIIDRLLYGKVVDFLDFYIKTWHWPAFNIADSAVTVGIFIFAYHVLLKKI